MILSWVMVAPLTTTVRTIPTAIPLNPREDGVPRRCVVSVDSIQSVRREWLDTRIVRLRPDKMQAIDGAIRFAFGLLH